MLFELGPSRLQTDLLGGECRGAVGQLTAPCGQFGFPLEQHRRPAFQLGSLGRNISFAVGQPARFLPEFGLLLVERLPTGLKLRAFGGQ